MNLTPDARTRDSQTLRIQEKITNVEKHFGEMCQLFAAYVRKTARLRDKGDMLVRELGLYADTETPNLRDSMKQFTDHLSKIQDYRHAEVERLDAKVLEPLKSYRALVKRQRDDLKTTQIARVREAKQRAQLEKTRMRNPSDRQTISKAETELHRATMDATRTTRKLEETIDEFEKLKVRDIKSIFSDFTLVEMSFHAKALEVYTLAYQSIQGLEEEEDLDPQRPLVQTRREEDDEEEDEDEEDEEEDESEEESEEVTDDEH
ncbi:CBY1-interacting BAR domain-containing protein 1 [Genypterus blacodes]|uniref:CBY1-interacting BAR domain-containing protein 1 n=1 Tax=Genypterus blacodes TaxID=154954 RepID=UPI003F768F46